MRGGWNLYQIGRTTVRFTRVLVARVFGLFVVGTQAGLELRRIRRRLWRVRPPATARKLNEARVTRLARRLLALSARRRVSAQRHCVRRRRRRSAGACAGGDVRRRRTYHRTERGGTRYDSDRRRRRQGVGRCRCDGRCVVRAVTFPELQRMRSASKKGEQRRGEKIDETPDVGHNRTQCRHKLLGCYRAHDTAQSLNHTQCTPDDHIPQKSKSHELELLKK